jgi:hypothetical protein
MSSQYNAGTEAGARLTGGGAADADTDARTEERAGSPSS